MVQKESAAAERKHCRFSFMVIELDDASEVPNSQYILKLDRDVNGYNFIGDQIRDGETEEGTAYRALRESISSSSLQSNWNVLSKDEVPEDEWESISSSILPLQKRRSHYFLPYLSGRSLPQSERCERLAVLYLYKLPVGPERCPKLYAKLVSLAKCNVSISHQESVPLCKTFTPADLVTEAWSNQDNPFIRFAFKHDILPFPKNELTAAPFLLHPPALEYCLERQLTSLLREKVSFEHEDFDGYLDVTMRCPGNDEVRFCLRTNRTLTASIEVRWSGGAKVASFTFPYPFQGVFILHSDTSLDGHAGKWIWHPRLVGKPGLWKLRKHSSRQGKRVCQEYLRLVPKATLYDDFPLESSSEVPLDEDKKKSLIKHCKKSNLRLGNDQLKSERKPLSEYIETIISTEAFDDQDLAWQRLYTYSALLIERIHGFFINKINMLQQQGEEKHAALSQWEDLCQIAHQTRLVPTSDNINFGWLHFFDPLNSLDAVAKLTSLQRYAYRNNIIDQLPAIFRQNHPSYQGIICPVETPESKNVGITLHLSRGVLTDAQGQIYRSENEQTAVDGDLGYGASLVPFYQHNDGPRSMMGAKNLKQAVPVKSSAPPRIKTGHEDTVQKITSSQRDIGIVPSCDAAAPGVDLLVAYMPWYGWNMEDAIVVNQELVNRGSLDWETVEERSAYILPGYTPTAPVFQNTFADAFKVLSYEKDGLRKRGRITPGDPLVFFMHSASGAVSPFPFADDHEGELVDIKFSDPPSTLLGGSLHWSIRRSFPLMVGDKLMGRYGNKGVVSLICDPADLPRLPHDKSLPPDFRGRAVDLILNPHGVISRMNLGQLLETSVGLLARLDNTCFPEDIGRAFNSIDWECFQRAVQAFNGKTKKTILDEYGRMFLSLPGGKITKAPVVVGYQHIVRLKHVAAKKANVRGRSGTDSQLPYNVITGQPVGGKRRKGGQRVGEMEIWALAANQARANLESVLTIKSDPAVSSKKPLTQGQTFQSIKDHLLAMGVEFQQTGEESFRFDWLSSQAIQQLGREVTGLDMWDLGLEGIYHCSKANCGYHLQRMRTTGKSQRGRTRVTIQDVLRHHGYQLGQNKENVPIPSGITGEGTREFQWVLEPLPESLEQRKKTITFQYSRTNRTVTIAFTIGRTSYSAFMQKNSAEVVPWQKVANFWLACPRHSASYLVCDDIRQRLFASPGGLCDEKIFGPVSVSDWDPNSWGYIKLPQPVPYPLSAPFQLGKEPPPLPHLDRIPVLPLKYRFRGFAKIGTAIVPQPEQLTDLYREIITLTKQKNSSRKLEKSVERLFTLLHDRLFGKFGLLRRAALGRRVDASGRLVIVPDPTLPWDACGIPTEVLVPLLGPKIIAHPDILGEFVQTPWADLLIKAIFDVDLSIPKSIEDLVVSEDFWTATPWFDSRISQAHMQLAHSIILRYLEKFPDTTVILNRQPSLHRYSIMTFRPIPLPPGNGLAMKINPLVCKAFGADFDGDEMAIHLPWSDEEQKEAAELMLPTHRWNLISVADNKPLANFDQDFVAGHFLLSREGEARKELQALVEELSRSKSGCSECSKLMSASSPWDRKHGVALLLHICADHAEHAGKFIPQWMQLALRVVTEHGLSFGFPELKKLQEEYREETKQLLAAISSEPELSKLTEITKSLGEMVLRKLNELAQQNPVAPGHGFATLAMSGARGDKQVRQIVSARGFLAPGDTGFELAPESFFIRESLVEGMTPASSFMAAMNARSSMLDKKLGTGKAGALTRSLVLAGWEWTVSPGDCGVHASGKRELTQCLWQKDRIICSACYGEIPGYDVVQNGYPAGLIAAQSFGERGTQLSMQSFHTAEKQLSIAEIVSLLNGKDYSVNATGGAKSNKRTYNWFVRENDAPEFVRRIQGIKSYENLDQRHLLLIWLIIHRSGGRTLNRVWKENRSAISGLIGPNQWTCLLEAIQERLEDDLGSPFARIMTSRLPRNMA
ncbi:MAG: hypothetical protein C4575_14085 [Desulforudis sp.]|jgi:hypothetical protein|nr:MAG: hypothetical protein C4575_14085 [Desulforudis sp.]